MTTRRLLPLAGLVLLALAAVTAATRQTSAQVGTVQPGTAAIWTDKTQYNIGDPIQVCFRIPIAGQVTITDLPSDGSSNVIYSQVVSTTHGCQDDTITPPGGRECLRMTYPLFGGSGQTQTCFTVLGNGPPPADLAIYTDQSFYTTGDPIDVCYRVPGPGQVRIIDQIEEDTPTTYFSGYDDGTGGCIPGTITPPAGRECMTIQYTYPADGQTATAETCFQTSP
jgi:hypothetical protein